MRMIIILTEMLRLYLQAKNNFLTLFDALDFATQNSYSLKLSDERIKNLRSFRLPKMRLRAYLNLPLTPRIVVRIRFQLHLLPEVVWEIIPNLRLS